MPLPLIPIIGAIASTVARVALPAVARAIAPKVISKPVLQAATKVVPKAATPKAVPKALPAAPKAAPKATPKPAATKPTAPSNATKATPTKTTTQYRDPKTGQFAKAPAPKPTSAAKVPSAVKKTVAVGGTAAAVGSLSGSTQQTPPRATGDISSGGSQTPRSSGNTSSSNTSSSSGSGSGSNNSQQYNDTYVESIEEQDDIYFDPEVEAEPPESGVSLGGGESNFGGDVAPPPIKSAPIDTVLFNDELVSAEIIADLLFENIGGQEILTIARHDTVNGQEVSYQPIKNLSAIQQQYSPETLVKIKGTSKDIFNNFPINLQSKIPNVGNGPGGSNVYIDADGNIIIEFVNLEDGQEVEVQITSSGTIESIGE